MSTPVMLKARETARLDEPLAAGGAIVMATVGPAVHDEDWDRALSRTERASDLHLTTSAPTRTA